jgi:phosphoribosylformylglycinamidine synthase
LFRNPALEKAVQDLLGRGGLVLGINDGFKALVKLGLLGVSGVFESDTGGRHLHRCVPVTAVNTSSPWLSEIKSGEVFVQPFSAAYGRFVGEVPESQAAFRYGNGDIEAITSPCGKVLGKMTHFERYGEFVAKNVHGNKLVPIFESAVRSIV